MIQPRKQPKARDPKETAPPFTFTIFIVKVLVFQFARPTYRKASLNFKIIYIINTITGFGQCFFGSAFACGR